MKEDDYFSQSTPHHINKLILKKVGQIEYTGSDTFTHFGNTMH